MAGWKELSQFVLDRDHCCGCGVCAGVCPHDALEMQFNEEGEYRPSLVGRCTDCGLCSKVCPFVSRNPKEDEIGEELFAGATGTKHASEAGYYLDTYVGSANDANVRWDGASGGLTTVLLCNLIEKRLVDHVIAVGPINQPEKLFAYRVVDTPEEVRRCAKSAYYPVEISHVLRQIRNRPGRYAVVGLPCVVKAIRLAQRQVPALRQRIGFLLGLTCGQSKSKFYTDYLILKAGLPGTVAKVGYRGKAIGQQANHFAFVTESVCGQQRTLGWVETVSEVWCNDWFKMSACFRCFDVFAECADVSLMDAWLPEYISDCHGTSLAIVRSAVMSELFAESANIHIEPTPMDAVLRSQRGVLWAKKVLNRAGMDVAVDRNEMRSGTALGMCLSRKRALKENFRCRAAIANATKARWGDCAGDIARFEQSIASFRAELEESERALRRNGQFRKLLRSPVATVISVLSHQFMRLDSSRSHGM